MDFLIKEMYSKYTCLDSGRRDFYKQKTPDDKFEYVWKLYAESTHYPVRKSELQSVHEVNKSAEISSAWMVFATDTEEEAEKSGNYSSLLDTYTHCVVFAPFLSEQLLLAYEKRTAVLFKMKLYKECLRDIKYAMEIIEKNRCMDDVKKNLQELREKCCEALKIDVNTDLRVIEEIIGLLEDTKLIPMIEQNNATIAGASDAIEFKDTDEHIVASRDIKTGEFIYISEPFAVVIGKSKLLTNCWHCSRHTWAGIPCENCSSVVFCSENCKTKAWDSYHSIECVPLDSLSYYTEVDKNKLMAVKIMSKTLISTHDPIQLQSKVEKIESKENKRFTFTEKKTNDNDIHNIHLLPYSIDKDKAQYEFYLLSVWITKIFLRTHTFNSKYPFKRTNLTLSAKSFGKLIVRYLMLSYRHDQLLAGEKINGVPAVNVMMPICNLFKKSCEPNVSWIHVDSKVAFYCIRPIKRGEKILISQCEYDDSSSTKTTDNYVPCECVGKCVTVDSLQSYQDMGVPEEVKTRLDYMTQRVEQFRDLVYHKDTKLEDLLETMGTLRVLNDELHQYGYNSCKEVASVRTLIKDLCRRLYPINTINDPSS